MSAEAAERRRRGRDDYVDTAATGELGGAVLGLLAHSSILALSVEPSMRDSLAASLSVLPFSVAEAAELLAPVAASGDHPPPFSLSGDTHPDLLLLTPLFPALRELSVHDAARAWVVVDLLCLGQAARRIEDDLVQRFILDPACCENWLAALDVAGCPSADALVKLLSKSYLIVKMKWEVVGIAPPLPPVFGSVLSAPPLRAAHAAWVRSTSLVLLDGIAARSLGGWGAALSPAILGVLHHNTDAEVVLSALTALQSFGSDVHYLGDYVVALRRFADSPAVVIKVCRLLQSIAVASSDHAGAIVTDGALVQLMRLLSRPTLEDPLEAAAVCSALLAMSLTPKSGGILTHRGGGIPLLATTLARFAGEVEVVRSVWQLIGNMATTGTENQAAFTAAGGARLLSAALSRFSDVTGTLDIRCFALEKLAEHGPFTTDCIREGGLPHMTTLLTTHARREATLLAACGALAVLVEAERNRPSVAACGCVGPLLAVLRTDGAYGGHDARGVDFWAREVLRAIKGWASPTEQQQLEAAAL